MMRDSKTWLKGRTRPAFGFLAEWLAFGLLALVATRPLASSWTTAIPLGSEPTPTVSLFNLWTLGWNIDRVNVGGQDYWDAPIFYPAQDAFAFSEPQPLMGLTAPVVWVGGSVAAAYNLYLWVGLSLTGVLASRLLWLSTQSRVAAWMGGAILVMLPFVHWQLGKTQLVPLCGILATLLALERFGEKPRVLRSLCLGTAFAITYFLCNYYGLFLSLLLILSGCCLLGRNLWNWRTWGRLLPGAVWCLLLIGPMIAHQYEVLHDPQWNRDIDYVRQQSASWGDFTAAPWPQLLPLREFVDQNRSGWTLSPGYLKLGLGLLGLAWGLYWPPLRRLTMFLMLFTALGYLLALGPRFHLGDWIPYAVIYDHYPGFKKARNAFRFVVFAQIGIGLLAAIGLAGLWKLVAGTWQQEAPRLPQHWGRRVGLVVVFLLGLLAVIEVWPPPQRLQSVPDLEQQRGWITWLKDNTYPDAPVACIPFPKGPQANDYLGNTIQMYYGLEHGRPLLNGYSGFFPPRYLELKAAMATFPDARSLQLLEDNGAQYCLIQRKDHSRAELERHPLARKRLKWRFGDNRANVDLYELLPRFE